MKKKKKVRIEKKKHKNTEKIIIKFIFLESKK